MSKSDKTLLVINMVNKTIMSSTNYSTNQTLNIIKDIEHIANEVAEVFFSTERYYYTETEFTRECELQTGSITLSATESNLYDEYEVRVDADILISDNTYVGLSTVLVEQNFRLTVEILLLKIVGIEVSSKKEIVALKNKCYKEISKENEFWEQAELEEMI